MKYTGTFEGLVAIVRELGFDVEHAKPKGQTTQLKTRDGAIVNWFPTTNTLQFQGPKPVRDRLESALAPRIGKPAPVVAETKLPATNIPPSWEKWCTTGRHGKGARKKFAVLKCLKSGHIRGYFSDIVLRPDLDPTHSMYPSLEHLSGPTNHAETVVEARIVNDMKSHLSEDEFWRVIDHLFLIGVQKGKIKAPFAKRLPVGWSPARHYTKEEEAEPTPGGDSSTRADAGLGTPQE